MAQQKQTPSDDRIATDYPAVTADAADYSGSSNIDARGAIDATALEVVARAAYGVRDTARTKITDDGVYLLETDQKNVQLVRAWMPADAFTDYTVDRAGVLGIPTGDFYDVTRFASGDVRFSVGYRPQNPGADAPALELASGNTYAGIDVTAPEDSLSGEISLPDFEFTAAVGLADGEPLRAFIKSLTGDASSAPVEVRATAADDGGVSVRFASRADGVDPFVATGDAIQAASVRDAPVETLLSAEYLKDAFKRVRKSDVSGVPFRLRFGEEYPLEVRRRLPGGGWVSWLTAPRIDG